ncbi:MAG: Na+/H+ antiporter, partial [Gemmatimonadota bacterium]
AAGLVIGLVPGAALPPLEPELVFLVFLPPILWSAAYGTSFRDFRANLEPIALLSVGLVLVTTVAVAFAARALMPGMPWAVAIALGAIVSPPDAIAAEAIIRRLPVPRRVISVLAGESLVNDASALVLYRTAIAAAVTGFFSPGEAVVRFFVDAGIGTLIGLFVGWLVVRTILLTRDPVAEVLIGLIGPYVAWVAGESLHVSSVLACVSGGLYMRQHFSTAVAPTTRIQSQAVWELFTFLLNAAIFILLGVQFGRLMEMVPAGTLARVVAAGFAISGVAIAVRLVWVPASLAVPRWIFGRGERDKLPPARGMFLVGWTSMRGIVSLAAALGLPVALANGAPFPYRSEIILITLCVIVVTLVLQGLTLAPLIRRLRFPPDTALEREERFARGEALRHGLEILDDLSGEPWAAAADVERLRNELRDRLQRHRDGVGGQYDAECRLRREVLSAERRELVRLRNENAISDDVLADLEQELDLEALRIGAGRS